MEFEQKRLLQKADVDSTEDPVNVIKALEGSRRQRELAAKRAGSGKKAS